ncbi:SurA N-terminal domain-containing protein [Thauera sinica]|uniref:Periplasmic chaperone PpiD n=1 Tax=Thauera sinica TaxID=2665146 RepID=A0ABW1AWB3_9RHOO|nr:SurA N-terminal domain-containing protein [Thauera sp. K11]ATE60413.1 peptidylprolyl isomerase [Thauera sp. K11]
MFEAVRKNQRVAQIILALLIIPFAFFGMDAYFRDAPGGGEVAVVDGTPITEGEFDRALREQQDRLRSAAGGQVDRAMLESEELRRAVLENLVNQRVLALYGMESRLNVTPAQLQQTIAGLESFQQDGRFSLERYEALLRAQGMSPAMFETRVAHDVRIQQVATAVGEAGFVPTASASRFLAAQLEERTIGEMRFPAARHVADIKPTDEEINQFYESNAASFERPARLKAEYVVLDHAAVEKQVAVSEEEVRAAYDSNPQRFGQPETRQARHILLQIEPGAAEGEVQKVTARAQELVAELRKDPSRFARLASENSQDPGSAGRGGDLGFFGHGVMVKAFEEAAFAQKKDEIGDPVRSEFGLHIIQVTAIKPSSIRPFAEVHDQIAAELRTQAAGRRFAELAEQFSNTVYEQSDSLAPVAEALKLEIRRTDWIARGADALGGHRSERLMNALFADEAVRNHRNTEAVEVGNNTLVAARAVEFEPAQRLPLEEVKARIADQLRNEAAAKKAVEQGEAVLAALNKGESATGAWSESRSLQRAAPGLPAAAMAAVFSAPTAKLPAYVGLAVPGGDYTIYRIEAVKRPELANDDPRVAAVAAQYRRLIAERDFSAFLAELRGRYKVELKLRPAAGAAG